MTGNQFLERLTELASEIDLDQEVYIKDGSNYMPLESIMLDNDKGILLDITHSIPCDLRNYTMYDKWMIQ